jgi:hypothetical protein
MTTNNTCTPFLEGSALFLDHLVAFVMDKALGIVYFFLPFFGSVIFPTCVLLYDSFVFSKILGKHF